MSVFSRLFRDDVVAMWSHHAFGPQIQPVKRRRPKRYRERPQRRMRMTLFPLLKVRAVRVSAEMSSTASARPSFTASSWRPRRRSSLRDCSNNSGGVSCRSESGLLLSNTSTSPRWLGRMHVGARAGAFIFDREPLHGVPAEPPIHSSVRTTD